VPLDREPATVPPNPYLPFTARVVGNLSAGGGYRLVQLVPDDEEVRRRPAHRPGQYVMAGAIGAGEAVCAIASSPTRQWPLEVIASHRWGQAGRALCDAPEGAVIGIRGPFGNGFPLEAMTGLDVLILADTVGFAAARALLWYALDRRRDFGRLSLVYSPDDPAEPLLRAELDGWAGRRDLTLVISAAGGGGLLEPLVPAPGATVAILCGGGDGGLLAADAAAACEALTAMGMSWDRVLVSLTRRLTCGVGACGRCAAGAKLVCVDGPVFSYRDALRLAEGVPR
jgi:sulfhydrogenase subunit gamma (sulfur reductase)